MYPDGRNSVLNDHPRKHSAKFMTRGKEIININDVSHTNICIEAALLVTLLREFLCPTSDANK
jgi:hypothetical protein